MLKGLWPLMSAFALVGGDLPAPGSNDTASVRPTDVFADIGKRAIARRFTRC